MGHATVKALVLAAQARARTGEIGPEVVADEAARSLPARATTLRPVINATGVVLHTNLGRARLSPAALDAVMAAATYVDVEYDVVTGQRARRGRGTLAALRAAVPDAGAVLAVNNGAAALVLATTALAAGHEVVVSRGEMVEIGDGFRLHELIASTGARLREVGTTNRTSLRDYAEAVGPATGCILKVHPSNFRVEGFTSAVPVSDLAGLGVPVVADIGSGLLSPDPLLPDEPDAATALRDGAAVVTCSADKLLGGPQGGLLLGRAEVIESLRRHPLARALRVDKLTLAALEATVGGPLPRRTATSTPTPTSSADGPSGWRPRPARTSSPRPAPSAAARPPVCDLPGWAVALPASYAQGLRLGDPCVVARVERGRCLVDLRCVEEHDDAALVTAIRAMEP